MGNDIILIVDDEKEIADLLELYLKNENYQIRKFYNAMDALACVEKENISLAILDLHFVERYGKNICFQLLC